MKKIMLFLLLFLLYTICGCSSKTIDPDKYIDNKNYEFEQSYEKGYQDGYDEGYLEGYENSKDNIPYYDHIEAAHDFEKMVVSLMYDEEPKIVEKIKHFFPKDVETALENEFGTKNIDEAMNLIKAEYYTIVGNCTICKEPIYSKDSKKDGNNYYHQNCFYEENGYPRIEKNN